MAGVSFPVSRAAGEAIVVASPAARSQAVATLATLGMASSAFDEPFAAMAELCRRPMVYRAMILSLAGVYTEELEIISAIKRRFPHVEIWVTHTDGRYSGLAEAMRLGADGLLADDGLHRIATPPTSAIPARRDSGGIPPTVDVSDPDNSHSNGHSSHPSNSSHLPAPATAPSGPSGDGAFGEPVLTADELRALLQEQPPFATEPDDQGVS